MNVLTLGTFDTFHIGHVNLLRACRLLAGEGGHVTVAVNSDGFVEAFKHHAPVIPFAQRCDVVRSCRYVDRVVPNSQTLVGTSAEATIYQAQPDLIVVGSDWQGRDYYAQIGTTQAFLDTTGTSVVFVPYTVGISSTLIREALR